MSLSSDRLVLPPGITLADNCNGHSGELECKQDLHLRDTLKNNTKETTKKQNLRRAFICLKETTLLMQKTSHLLFLDFRVFTVWLIFKLSPLY